MINSKNLSPQQLSFFTALILSVPVIIGAWLLRPQWMMVLICFASFLLACYGLILFTLQRFIYRRIKVIYKFIYQTKATKREETYYKYILPHKSIDEVSEDVEKWAAQRSSEIEVLRQNESYRKEFLQNLAHELKTPIFAIQGYVNTLLDGALEDPDVSTKFLDKANKNVERMVSLVNDLDEISRLESGEQPLYKQNFLIRDLIKEVFDTLSVQADEKKIVLQFKRSVLDVTIFADKEKIRQVLTNLVGNAIKYGRQNGNVTAGIYKTDGRHFLIEISDDGMGIPEEHLGRIFERFYRIDTARSRKIGGSGLGLAICKHIIEAHGQSIHVRSKEDVGSTFGFVLEGGR
jgi:two-component system phosphate regulon sensor histidine kinase PhoR